MKRYNNAIYSTMVRAGKRTYFLDVKERGKTKHVELTESYIDAKGVRKRTKLSIDAETFKQLAIAASEASACL